MTVKDSNMQLESVPVCLGCLHETPKLSYPALISSIKKLCMCTVRALKRKCARVACHCQKTAGGCIDFRWSTNIQLVVMRTVSVPAFCLKNYFRQHFSGPFCAIIIHPVNITKKQIRNQSLYVLKNFHK